MAASVADSLRDVIEQHNSLIAYIANHSETVRVVVHDTTLVEALPGTVGVAITEPLEVKHDLLDIAGVVLVPVAIVLVTLWGADRSARVGAREGARLAQESGMTMLGEERRLEREHALERLHRRVESNLRRVEELSEGCRNHDPKEPLDPDVGVRLEVIWNLYYRVFEPIFLMGDSHLAEDIDSFFVDLHTLGVAIDRMEALGRQASFGAPDSQEHRNNYKVRERVVADRGKVLEKLKKFGPMATALLVRVQAIQRSQTTLTAAKGVGSSDSR